MLVLMALNARLGFTELAGASFFVRYMLVFGLFTHTVSAGRTQGIQHLSVTPLAAWGGTESGQPSTLGCTLCSSIPYQHDELYRKSQRFSALSANSDERACMTQWVFLIDDDGNLVQTLARDVPIPKNAREAVNDPLWGKHWRKSIDDEVQNMFDSKVWKVVKLPNDRTVNIVDTSWCSNVNLCLMGALSAFDRVLWRVASLRSKALTIGRHLLLLSAVRRFDFKCVML